MKNLVLASMVLFSTVSYSQDGLLAQSDKNGSRETTTYTLNDAVATNNVIMLGNADAKSKKGRTINVDGRTAYYFGNPGKQEGFFLNSVLFKVQKVKHKTQARIRLYEKHEYVQDTYHPKTSVKNSYTSFIPGEQIPTDIIVFLEPGQKGVIEIDLSQYNIVMPKDGLFVSLEGTGYYDDNGKTLDHLDPKDMTWIEFHPAADDNFCEWVHTTGSDSRFWMNVNKWLRNDYEFAFETDVPKKVLKAPNFGLKVERR